MRAGISKPASLAIALAVVLLIAVSTVVFTQSGTTTSTAISTTTSSPPSSSFSVTASSASNSTGVGTGSCGLGVQLITVRGSTTEYCADDVANDTVLGGPGYSYFRNESITFMGVTFQTICPSEYMSCPGANSTAATVMLGIMRFTMAFPDKTNETLSGVIGDDTYIPILSSQSNPRAGMLIEITYGAHETTDHVFLLVAGPGAGISSNTAVATLTVTETLTTQGSQATTTYAIPTSSCTLLGGEFVTTSTITVGAASTTTVTVTTTSTSYTQTVTMTSCTYSRSTVTSTVTSTMNP